MEVLYIGWKSYGIFWQVVPLGSKLHLPKVLAALAVMNPCWRSRAFNNVNAQAMGGIRHDKLPGGSPEFLKRSCCGFGV